MPELQMDVAVANRFISSLSKSLQALCHGCMDFDTGIEIVGYINVNIDCGSKVDYVLNEKVLKSTTNSMTFVSNSFLAKKDQPKQTRDGTCSPIPELNPPPVSPFQNRSRGYFHGMHPRNVAPVPHSNVQRGAQKRSWGGMERDWRMSPKKQRDGRPFYPSAHESSSTAQDTHSGPSSSSHPPTDSEFKHPQTSFQGSDASNVDSQSEVNIKKEFLENDSVRETDYSEQDQSQTFDQNTNDNLDPASGVASIKRDPDASSADVDDETSTADQTVNESADYKDTFLEPSTSEDNQGASEHDRTDSGAHDDSQIESGDLVPETSTETAENIATGSEMQGDYDEGAEEAAYPHSVYSDTGEGSSDAGQFEVIEIDDEDEDVQAMFGGPQQLLGSEAWSFSSVTASSSSSASLGCRSAVRKTRRGHRSGPLVATRFAQPLPTPDASRETTHEGNVDRSSLLCTLCAAQFSNKYDLKSHISAQHGHHMPFTCTLCGKGYQTAMGLTYHKRAHEGTSYPCPLCDSRLTQRSSMKAHLKNIHSVGQCATCSGIFKLGQEYNQHVLHCVS